MNRILTIDIGGTKTRLVWFDTNFSNISEASTAPILRELQFPTPNNIDEFINLLLSAICDNSPELENLTTISIASRGLIKDDTITDPPLNMIDFPIISKLQKEFPNAKIFLGNDANIGAIGAFPTDFHGRGLYLALGTGIGGGLIINGRLSEDLLHMEFGHMQFWRDGKLQKWQDFASGKAFFEKYRLDGTEIPHDDPIWREYAENLLLGLAVLIPTLYPNKIIIGGGIAELFPKFGDILSDLVKENIWSPTPPILLKKMFGCSRNPIEITSADESHYTVNRGALVYALKNLNLDDEK